MYWDASDRRNERSNAIARATFFEQSGKAGYRVGPTHKPTIFRSRRTVNIHVQSEGGSNLEAAWRRISRSIFRFVDIDAADVFEAVVEFFNHEHRGA